MADVAPPIDQASLLKGDQELSILTEIGRILSSTLELREAFGQIMQSISDKMDMHRGALVLLDESTGRLRTEAAVGNACFTWFSTASWAIRVRACSAARV